MKHLPTEILYGYRDALKKVNLAGHSSPWVRAASRELDKLGATKERALQMIEDELMARRVGGE